MKIKFNRPEAKRIASLENESGVASYEVVPSGQEVDGSSVFISLNTSS